MAGNEVARADDVVAKALGLPDGDREKYLSEVFTNMVGMVAETDEARVAQAEENDKLRESLDYTEAQNQRMLRVLEQHGIDVEQTGFDYQPRPRRKRQRTVRTPMDILSSLLGIRPPEPEVRPLVEATPTGTITSVPKAERDEAFDAGNVSLRDHIDAERSKTPVVLTDMQTEPGFVPPYRRGVEVAEPEIADRGIDPDPATLIVSNPESIDLQTGRVTIQTTTTPVIDIPAPEPKSAHDVVRDEEHPELSLIEDKVSRRERVRQQRRERRPFWGRK